MALRNVSAVSAQHSSAHDWNLCKSAWRSIYRLNGFRQSFTAFLSFLKHQSSIQMTCLEAVHCMQHPHSIHSKDLELRSKTTKAEVMKFMYTLHTQGKASSSYADVCFQSNSPELLTPTQAFSMTSNSMDIS